jgi:hypothetical protein
MKERANSMKEWQKQKSPVDGDILILGVKWS